MTLNGFLGSKFGWVVTLALAAIGAYLLWNHTGHLVYALPYLFLLACPLMHLFGHRHHGHQHDQPRENPK
jgi:fucose permease